MRPLCNSGKADGDIDISASRLHIKLKFSGMVKETCIFNSNIKVIRAVKSSHSQKQKTIHLHCQSPVEPEKKKLLNRKIGPL